MTTHPSTYEYLMPTQAQIETMAKLRAAAKAYNDVLDVELPDGPDKTFIIRTHRSNAMWANVTVTRHPTELPVSRFTKTVLGLLVLSPLVYIDYTLALLWIDNGGTLPVLLAMALMGVAMFGAAFMVTGVLFIALAIGTFAFSRIR